jgi:hypothetical protein
MWIGGYSAFRSANTVFEGNAIAYNGSEQKVVGATTITFRNKNLQFCANSYRVPSAGTKYFVWGVGSAG